MTDQIVDETSSFISGSEEDQQQPVATQEEPASSESETPVVDVKAEEAEPKGEAPKAEEDEPTPGDESTAEANVDKKDKGGKKGFGKRLGELTKQREEARRENEALKRENEQLKAAKGEDKKEPIESDFETYDEYLDALDKGDKPEAKADKSNDKATDLTDSQKTAQAILQEKLNSVDLPENFEAVALKQDLPITGEMVEALAECDSPEKVMLYLGNNEKQAADISEMSPVQQMREIAKIDLSIEVAPKKQVKISNAPDPINPVKGSDAIEKSLEDMDFSEYEAKRNKESRNRY